MVTDQASIGSLSFFSQFLPFTALLEDLVLFEVEMPPDDRFETFWWILDVFKHCVLDVTISDNVGISLILLLALNTALLVLKAWLVEVDVLAHDNGLDGDQHLQQGRYLGIPVLHGLTSPSSQQTQTNFSTSIQVGIEPHLSVASGHQVDLGRVVRVAILEVNIKEVGSVAIRSAIGAHDQSLHKVHSFFVTSDVYGIGMVDGQSV